MRAKAKLYADKKRHVEYSDLVPEPYDVVSRNGSSILIKSPEGVQLKRNTAHLKKYEEPLPMSSQTVPLPVEKGVQAKSPTLPTDLETDGGKKRNAVSKRPALTDLETECRKARTAVYQTSSS
ncbi:unnamed protein product [Porites lobata]|uniref:Uncharacterized protein n=1 Tax=Porites lobata TaxID=104759 RepID=A0ABN8NR90_9CNID|nr:unnamed protein product [Porites lobata]